MTDIQKQIAAALGVGTQQAAAINKRNPPPRPEARYVYSVNLLRRQYEGVDVVAGGDVDGSDLLDLVLEKNILDDDGEWEIEDYDQHDCVNESELDSWDAVYGAYFTEDGDPYCGDCNDIYDVDDLRDRGDDFVCEHCDEMLVCEHCDEMDDNF
jgi:hypothetical protein